MKLLKWPKKCIKGFIVDGKSFSHVQEQKVSEWWKTKERNRNEPGSKTTVQALLADLQACNKTRNLQRGKQVHCEVVEFGHDSNIYVANALMNMYAKCGSIVNARLVFEELKDPTVVSWTTLILAYADIGQGYIALDLFSRMTTEGPPPNSVTFLAALKACISLKPGDSRGRVKAIYNLAIEGGCSSQIHLQCTLIDTFAKTRNMVDARQLFDRMKNPDVVSWNVLILGYADNGQSHIALELFTRIKTPTFVTFIVAFKACVSLAVNEKGKALHNLAEENGCSSEISVQNSVIDMHSKCGNMACARQLFDAMKSPDVVSWTALISGYVENGQHLTALKFFICMGTGTEGPAPNSLTFVAVLKACTSVTEKKQASDMAKIIHSLAIENSCGSDIYVENTLLGVYAKCGSIIDARHVFDSMKYPDVVSWNSLIFGYTDIGQGNIALELFTRMNIEGSAQDSRTFAAVIKACGLVGALELGRTLHSEYNKGKLDVVLVNCLVDFYARCGSLLEAKTVFDVHAQVRDVITWNSLLSGFSSVGDNETVFGLFEGMQDAGFWPDAITFTCILTCCSHTGLVEKGKECFDAMSTKYGIIPSVEHYTCMIDIFGRANMIDDAMALLKHMPCIPDHVTWKTILDACRKWKNVDVGKLAFESMVNLNDRDSAGYALMGEIFRVEALVQEIKKSKIEN